jgi:hypothetical protein
MNRQDYIDIQRKVESDFAFEFFKRWLVEQKQYALDDLLSLNPGDHDYRLTLAIKARVFDTVLADFSHHVKQLIQSSKDE